MPITTPSISKPEAVWLTTGQCAAACGVNRSTLWRWIRSGLIARKYLLPVGDTTRVHRDWLKVRP
jgi:hypothetical protein